jgi:nucleoside-diphosphate-sugar epimerase
MAGLALVVGASGIVGKNLARHLRARAWQVYGLGAAARQRH